MTTYDHAGTTSLDKDSAVPLHIQLREALRRQIVSDRWAAHTQLPSERELCERYGVSRITVRQALGDLLRAGLIYTSAGKGTYVAVPRLQEEIQPLSSFTQDMRRRGLTPSSRILEAGLVAADEDVAALLHLPHGAEVVRLYRLRQADGVPIAVQLTWLPHSLCPGLLRFDLAERSLFEVLRQEYGHKLARAETRIQAALARRDESLLLQVPTPAAVLISEQTTFLDNDAVVEWTHSVFRGDRYQLHTRM